MPGAIQSRELLYNTKSTKSTGIAGALITEAVDFKRGNVMPENSPVVDYLFRKQTFGIYSEN